MIISDIFKKKNILFIEDDLIMRQETEKVLNMFFNNVWTAENGLDGYEYYQKFHPDIILTDIQMPEMDGFELTECIRKDDRRIPIVILSSHSEREVLLKAINLGIDAFVLKPIELENMLEMLEKAFNKQKQLDINYTFNENIVFNASNNELFIDNELVKLGIKEQLLLNYFVTNINKSITKEQIIDKIWPLDEISDSALKSLLYRLRKKIGHDIIISVQDNTWKLICKK